MAFNLTQTIQTRLRTTGAPSLARVRYRGPKQRSANGDLLDANESTWAFVAIDRVGSVQKSEVRRLGALASEGR